MKLRSTYINRHIRRLKIVVMSALIFVAEAAFTPAQPYIAGPLPPRESFLLQTRAEILVALDRTAPRLSELERVEMAEIVAEVCHYNGVDPMMILAVMAVESEFKDDARSSVGAIGLMQLMRPTAFEWTQKLKRPMHELGLYDWRTNIELGATYLRFLHDRLGSWPMALAAYNWGPTKVVHAVRENQRHIPKHMRAYEKRVMRQYKRMVDAASKVRTTNEAI